MKKYSYLSLFCFLFLFAGCVGKNANIASSGQNDVMIHQLRVELEEIKHHIHTTVMQMNILTNKMVNTEDAIFELKQKELITQKQTLESNASRLSKIEKKMEDLQSENEEKSLSFKAVEEEVKVHTRALHQNKKKLHELEKSTISILDESATN